VSHGWRVVAFCFLAAVFTWGLGVFGASVYLHEVTKARGWSVSLVSAGITVFYLTAAMVLPAVGAAINRRGSRPVIAGGAVLLALGVAAMGHVAAPWQLHAAFVCMGLGYSTMSVIGLSATIADAKSLLQSDQRRQLAQVPQSGMSVVAGGGAVAALDVGAMPDTCAFRSIVTTQIGAS